MKHRIGVALLMGSTFIVFAGPARALTITPNPFVVDHGSVEGTVELVDVVTGLPTGGSVGLGVISPTATTLVFSVEIGAASAIAQGLWLRVVDAGVGVLPDATGWIPGPDADISIFGGGGADAWSGFVPASTLPGTAIDFVFLSYDAALAAEGSLIVEAGLLSSPSAGGSAAIVPEPATAPLFLLGLCALGNVRPRRSRRTY